MTLLFPESVVSPLSERAHQGGGGGVPPRKRPMNVRRFFDVAVKSSASSLTYLSLFSEELIGVAIE
jgi:hypothetical protein